MKLKRTFSLLLSLTLVLGLFSGCGDKAKPVTSSPEESVAALDISEIGKQELLYAAELGFPVEKVQQETISGKEMAELLDKLVEYAAPDKVEEWKALLPKLRTHKGTLTRFDAMGALFLAAQTAGDDWAEYKSDFALVYGALQFPWDQYYFTDGLFGEYDSPRYTVPGSGDSHYLDSACLPFNLSHPSPVSKEFPFAYDAAANSIHEDMPPTYAECVLAVVRLIESVECETEVHVGLTWGTSIDDPAATTPNPNILTPELLAKAAENPVVTSEDHPRWTGFVLNYTAAPGEFLTTPRELELSAEWGFNAARLFLRYESLFGKDATTVNINMLEKLDEMVATAIEHDMHLDIMLASLPGRCVQEAAPGNDYISTAELDLFINEEKQEMAKRVFEVLAKRYKDVPNFNLSISPFYEALNKNLSTGLPYTDFTPEDVAAFLGEVIDVIRVEDPDRLIIYEATPANHWDTIIPESTPAKTVADEKGNVMISYNFCQNSYVYACMTAASDEHIDNMNNSMYIPEYPNYIYSVATSVWVGAPIRLNGLLPAGTTLDLYLERSGSGGTLDISVDGVSLYHENLQEAEYEIGERLSGYYPFATSEKQITITLLEDAEEVVISCLRDGGFDICGIKLTLPEKYAVDRWYYAQEYDVYTGKEAESGVTLKSTSEVLISPNYHDSGRSITIHDDLSYTTEHIYEAASAETIAEWSDTIADFDGNCVVRFERADFSGGIWPEMKEYYEALLQSFEEYGFSWWSNDWWIMTDEYPQTKIIAECPSTEYAGYEHFNLELLELLQKYQSKG